jgi:hypothetical protein
MRTRAAEQHEQKRSFLCLVTTSYAPIYLDEHCLHSDARQIDAGWERGPVLRGIGPMRATVRLCQRLAGWLASGRAL